MLRMGLQKVPMNFFSLSEGNCMGLSFTLMIKQKGKNWVFVGHLPSRKDARMCPFVSSVFLSNIICKHIISNTAATEKCFSPNQRTLLPRQTVTLYINLCLAVNLDIMNLFENYKYFWKCLNVFYPLNLSAHKIYLPWFLEIFQTLKIYPIS